MLIGVLALQGDFMEHMRSLQQYGVSGLEVRTVDDLNKVDALILPGGESTTMAKLLLSTGLDKAIRARAKKGMPIWGTCAGAILLAKNVISEVPLATTLGLLDITIERNSYGRQAESFVSEIDLSPIRRFGSPLFVDSDVRARHKNHKVHLQHHGISKDLGRSKVYFIRSPRITKVGRGVKVLARHHRDPVLVQKGHILASTFHAELPLQNPVLAYFLSL